VRLARLQLRRYRLQIGVWTLLLIAICAGTVTAYQNTYATTQQRHEATVLAQHNAATNLMYGWLADAGTPAQMFTWEIGAIVTVLTAVMAVLVAVSLTRTPEDDGTLELLRGCGVAAGHPLRSAFGLLSLIAAVLTAGCAVGVGIWTGRVDAVGWPGALSFGLVVGLTFLLVASLTLVAAQIAPSAGPARLIGFLTVGVAFALRAVADTQHASWLNWASPLGLRATVRPFSGLRWWAFAPPLLAVLALAVLAVVLAGRREFRAGLVRRRQRNDARLHAGGPTRLALRLARSSLLAWTIGVALIGALFSAMGSGVVRQSRDSSVGGFLGSQLGSGDPAAGYLAYNSVIVGLLVCAFAVLSVTTAQRDESAGLTDLVLAHGLRRWSPLAAQAAVTMLGAAGILLVTGAFAALIAPMVIDGHAIAERSLTYTVGQWPAVIAMTGCTALLYGLRPRLVWLAWVPLAASGLLALLGGLLKVPQRVQDLGLLRHVPDVAGAHPQPTALLVLLGLGVLLCLVGLYSTTARDVRTG
jgi:polyether ionophore transport system permease protein